MKKTIIKYAILTACGVALFIVLNHYATASRGYRAIGGEGFLVLLPVLWWIAEALIRDTRNEK